MSSAPRDPAAPKDLPVRIGVSSCLLGREVRFDGGHKRDQFLVDDLGRHVEWVPVCPELEVGMGVPREAVRLVSGGSPGDVRMVGTKSGEDWTERMQAYARKKLKALEKLELSGYVLKSKSPTCGMERVKVYTANAAADRKAPEKKGTGLFAAALKERFPHLPLEEEGRLNDPLLRENFIERVFCYHRWLLFTKERFTVGRLVEFHGRHKYVLMAHSEKHLRKLGPLVAAAKGRPPQEVMTEYSALFFEGMAATATVSRHVNVLQHTCGYFRERLDAADRKEILEAIENYRLGLVPRIVPQTLMLHHVRRLEVPYLEDQYYFLPHPKELVLKYHC
jgi:uncharacterized protein YbbK (DUF523 family)/uncharacterized protein YbgA (DUF1722 family)